ncbi:hypothetical protein GCM10009744_62690 [Kribbella alba]|uniref:Enoyl reductase n=1 Tax=Kribbella alba TaxID=190197 RepID=A0ABP4RTK3_9ACTN
MLTRRPTILASLALGTFALLATSPSAHADRLPGNPTPVASGNKVSITITGTGVSGGSGGQGGSRAVSVATPCSYTQGMTGKEYYDYIQGGGPLGRDETGTPFKPNPGYEQYKDDDKGHWYGGMCSSETFGDLDKFFDYAKKWFEAHDAIYVQPGGRLPVPPVPPELLQKVAFDEMTLPPPAIDWNPKHVGDAASVVNFDTWVWLKDRSTNRYVEASVDSIEGRIFARVDADLVGMTVQAPDTETVECPGSGVPYSEGATGECAIRFGKASPGQSKTPVTVQTNWHTTWFGTGVGRTETPQQPGPATAPTPIRVLEIQAISR